MNVWTYEMENFPEVTKEEEKEYILLKPVFCKKRWKFRRHMIWYPQKGACAYGNVKEEWNLIEKKKEKRKGRDGIRYKWNFKKNIKWPENW